MMQYFFSLMSEANLCLIVSYFCQPTLSRFPDERREYWWDYFPAWNFWQNWSHNCKFPVVCSKVMLIVESNWLVQGCNGSQDLGATIVHFHKCCAGPPFGSPETHKPTSWLKFSVEWECAYIWAIPLVSVPPVLWSSKDQSFLSMTVLEHGMGWAP